MLGLQEGNLSFSPALGYVLRAFFINELVPLLLFLSLFKGHLKVGKTVNLSWSFAIIGVALLILLSLSVFVFGVNSKFVFMDYRARNLSVLAYCFFGLYLLYVFRGTNPINMLLFVVWGILVVEELWELPLNCVRVGGHPLVFVTGILARYVTIFVWFYLFRSFYINLFRKHFLLVLPCLLTIASLTLLLLSYQMRLHYGFILDVLVSTSLRAVYGITLIVLPFQLAK